MPRILLLFLAGLCGGCVAPNGSKPALLAQWLGRYDGGMTAGVRVLRTEAEWRNFWKSVRHDPPRKFRPRREMAVVVTLGEKPTGGYTVEITGVRQQDNRLIIDYRETAPEPGSMNTQALTQPWSAAVVTRSDLPVVGESHRVSTPPEPTPSPRRQSASVRTSAVLAR